MDQCAKKQLWRRIAAFVCEYAVLAAAMSAGEFFFMLCNGGVYFDYGPGDWVSALWHGIPMNMSTAGYLAYPVLLLALCRAPGRRWTLWSWRAWSWLAASAIAFAVVLDIALYPYWEFKLDATPIFYFTSSPASAMASVSFWTVILGLLSAAAFAFAIHWAMQRIWILFEPSAAPRGTWWLAGAGTLFAGLLFLAVRGGVTVSTMNLSSAYYTDDRRLCHAAVNPLFSLMFSLMHQNHPGDEFRFFKPARARALMAEMLAPDSGAVCEERPVLSTPRPDIYIIILESFSAHLMPSLGGEAVAPGLDSIARSGVSFSRCYASSFRTDRALPAILSGFPAQPSMTLMKYTPKIERLPSLPRILRDNGYDLAYYYGGDASFTNMGAYVRSMGFGRFVSDRDFPVGERLSKWGVHDHVLLGRAKERWRQPTEAPMLTVVQTSSSHEPYDVPYRSPFSNERANAFAYTDHWVTDFVNSLRDSGRWNRSIVVIVPDHWGCYPEGLEDKVARHHIPLVFTGGALADEPRTIGSITAQTDIAATLLGMMGIGHGELKWSRDVFDPSVRRHAFFSEPDWAVLVTDDGVADIVTADLHPSDHTGRRDWTRAYLQTLYDDIERL